MKETPLVLNRVVQRGSLSSKNPKQARSCLGGIVGYRMYMDFDSIITFLQFFVCNDYPVCVYVGMLFTSGTMYEPAARKLLVCIILIDVTRLEVSRL